MLVIVRCAECGTAHNYDTADGPRTPFICDACMLGLPKPTSTPHEIVSRNPDENRPRTPPVGSIRRAPLPSQPGPKTMEAILAPEYQELLARVDPEEAARQAAIVKQALKSDERAVAEPQEESETEDGDVDAGNSGGTAHVPLAASIGAKVDGETPSV